MSTSRFDHMRGICNTVKLFLTTCNHYSPPKTQTGVPPLVECPLLIIQYIRSYPPYLKAVFSIRNPKSPTP